LEKKSSTVASKPVILLSMDDTILASTTPPNGGSSEALDTVVIQQHDTVVNNSVKKDICCVSPLTPSNLTPLVFKSQVQTVNDQVPTEGKNTNYGDLMEVEDITVEDNVGITESSSTVHYEEIISEGDAQQISTTEIIMKDETSSEKNNVTDFMETSESNIDAAILGEQNAKVDAADGYTSSDLDSSTDSDDEPAEKNGSQDEDSSSDR
jgi:hypothetical protein